MSIIAFTLQHEVEMRQFSLQCEHLEVRDVSLKYTYCHNGSIHRKQSLPQTLIQRAI